MDIQSMIDSAYLDELARISRDDLYRIKAEAVQDFCKTLEKKLNTPDAIYGPFRADQGRLHDDEYNRIMQRCIDVLESSEDTRFSLYDLVDAVTNPTIDLDVSALLNLHMNDFEDAVAALADAKRQQYMSDFETTNDLHVYKTAEDLPHLVYIHHLSKSHDNNDANEG